MKTRIAVVASLLCVAGCRLVAPPPPPDAPRIQSFTADKTRVGPGQTVTLSYSTSQGTKVEIIDDSGRQLELVGDVEAGTATVAPARSSVYVLRLTGLGGADTAFVQVAVNEPLQTTFLFAVPAVIRAGGQAQLVWGAAGASAVTLTTGMGTPQVLAGTTGIVTVSPTSTQNYTLTAQGAPGTGPLTALADVQVRPVLEAASVEAADGYQVGKTVHFAWKTLGASRVVVSERTLGQLASVTDAALVADGTFDFVLPATLPNGLDVADGLPLRFRVEASGGTETDAQQFERVIGERPVLEFFDAPLNGSVGRTWIVSWKTLNATQISIDVAGQEVFRTFPADLARVAEGSVSLPTPLASTDYRLTASNARGAVSRTFTVQPVALPTITSYALTGTFAAIGDPVTATWTASDAVSAHLRRENGATLATVTAAAQVASGSVVLTPAGSTNVTLEVFNAAGDSATETRTVTFTGTAAAVITPDPVLRGGTATLGWTLAPSVLEVVGLSTPPPAAVTASTAFIDLSTVSSARPLFFADTAGGAARVPTIPGFRFPLLGVPRTELWVSANGFIAFSRPATLSANADLSATTDTTPSMLAPFWDDLDLPPTAEVRYAVQTMTNGERALIVQWDKAQLASDATSELTFQAQLYETGQVSFVYDTLTAAAALDSVTIGVKDTAFPAAQVYTFNSATVVPVTGNEVSFFTAGPADGTLSFAAGAARAYDFFGRTATGRVPVSATLRSFGPGDVEVSEVMAVPEASVSALGKWIELRNRTAATLDFGGLRVDTLGSVTPDGGYDIPAGTRVDAGAFLVIGQSTNPADTGGARVDLVGTDLPLTPDDRVRVRLSGSNLASFTFATPDAGVSAQQPDVLVASAQTFTCVRTQTFGTTGAVGTPQAPNEPCGPYVMSSIPGRFTEGPADSTILPTAADDEGYGNLDLPQPFTYFGTSMTRLGFSANGFITLQSAQVTSGSFTNGTTPSTSTPNGVLALFWDDLVRGAGRHAMWREADRTIVSYENVALYASPRLTAAEMALNFQVHLVDSGVIEFHYGAMTTSLPGRVNEVAGSSATVWLERQDGVIAVPFSVNQPRVLPNSGVRFTPRP